MAFKIKHLKHWQSTVLGILLIIGAILYIMYGENIDRIIFFGVLGIGIALLFLPNTFIRGLRSLVKSNQDKEL